MHNHRTPGVPPREPPTPVEATVPVVTDDPTTVPGDGPRQTQQPSVRRAAHGGPLLGTLSDGVPDVRDDRPSPRLSGDDMLADCCDHRTPHLDEHRIGVTWGTAGASAGHGTPEAVGEDTG